MTLSISLGLCAFVKPKGHARLCRPEEYRDKIGIKKVIPQDPNSEYSKKRRDTKRQNIEKVFEAIQSGNSTLKKIMAASGIGRSTCINAAESLAIDKRVTIKHSSQGNTYSIGKEP